MTDLTKELGIVQRLLIDTPEAKDVLARIKSEVARLEQKASCGYPDGRGKNCGECWDCLKVNSYFFKEAAERQKARAEAAEAKLARLERIEEAARRAAILTYDPSRKDSENDEYQRRARALNKALAEEGGDPEPMTTYRPGLENNPFPEEEGDRERPMPGWGRIPEIGLGADRE